MTLLHFIALTVKEKYPDLATFWHELHFVEKAAAGEGSLPPAWGSVRKLSKRNTWAHFWLLLSYYFKAFR